MQKKRIEKVLLDKGMITQNQLSWALSRKEVTGDKLSTIFLNENIVDPVKLAQVWAEIYELDFIDLDNTEINRSLLERVPENAIRAYKFLPLTINNNNCLEIAVSDPSDSFAIESIKMVTGFDCLVKVASKSAVERKIASVHDSALAGQEKAPLSLANVPLESLVEDVNIEFVTDTPDVVDLGLANSKDDHTPVITLVNKLIFTAAKMRASDIHFEVFEKNLVVKYRIDGVLHEQLQLERKAHNAVVSRIKVLSNMDITEKKMPQDGSFKLKVDDTQVDFRVSILPSYYGQNVVIRILNQKSIPLSLNSLGFENDMIESFKRIIRRPYGLILVTGPTGSGKTTTLYSAINSMDREHNNIVTVENPVEFQIPGVHQMQVNINSHDESKSLTFAKGLRSILRHDPDVIMVGEIRDSETADIAIQAASTGHLVLSTIHANTSIDVIGRFLSLQVDRYLFTNSLNIIIAQRLVRKICPYCKEKTGLSKDDALAAGLDPEKIKQFVLYKGRGCSNCGNTGYLGRTAICEYIEIDDDIRQMIDEKHSFVKIRKAAVDRGMKTLRQACIEKVLSGITSITEFIKIIGDIRK
jgi:type IV pilus assembly protein PilB